MPRLWIYLFATLLAFSTARAEAADTASPFGTLRAATPAVPGIRIKPNPLVKPLPALAEGPAVPERVLTRLRFRLLARQEAETVGVPYDLVDAVMDIESGYDPMRRGDVGEIGLMQVRPATASMLGFHGDDAKLAQPATNIHYGTAYLGRAWQLAGGNVCRALMKYRAGHGEEAMSDKSVTYCQRARAHLRAANSPLADTIRPGDLVATLVTARVTTPRFDASPIATVQERGAKPKRTAAGAAIPPIPVKLAHKSSARFWTAFEARIRKINARIEAKWRRMAAR